jgi:hypothetical protein
VPAVPDEPDDPEVPELPLVPDEPDVPAVPDVPELPDVPDVPEEPLPPTVAITVPAVAFVKYTFKLLLSITSICVGITTLSLESKTLIAGYLYPKLCANDQVVAAEP